VAGEGERISQTAGKKTDMYEYMYMMMPIVDSSLDGFGRGRKPRGKQG
jgi:hypothetical protein